MDPKFPFSSHTSPHPHAAASSSSSSGIFNPDYPLLSPALWDAMFPTPTPPPANACNLFQPPITNPSAAASAPPQLINSMGASHLVTPPTALPYRFLSAFDELLKSVPEPRSFTSFLNSNIAMFETSMNPLFPPQCGATPAAAPLPRSTLDSHSQDLLGLQSSAAAPFGAAAFGGRARLGPEQAPQGKFLGQTSSEHTLLNSQEPTEKKKYYCHACRVRFGTSQALGGHMSSHSKLRKVPAASSKMPVTEASASSGARWRKSRSMCKKAIAKGKAVVAKKITASSHANTSAIHQSQIATNNDSRGVEQDKQKKKAEDNNIMNTAAMISTRLPDENDGFGDLVDQLWLYDGCDMDDFSSLFDN